MIGDTQSAHKACLQVFMYKCIAVLSFDRSLVSRAPFVIVTKAHIVIDQKRVHIPYHKMLRLTVATTAAGVIMDNVRNAAA